MDQEATDEILRTQLRKAYEFAEIMHGRCQFRNRDDLIAPMEATLDVIQKIEAILDRAFSNLESKSRASE